MKSDKTHNVPLNEDLFRKVISDISRHLGVENW